MMKNYDIHFRSGETVGVKDTSERVATAANPENGAVILKGWRGQEVIINTSTVMFIVERWSQALEPDGTV